MVLLILLLVPLATVGCCDKRPVKYDVTVSLDDAFRKDLSDRKVTVHLVGISEKQNERWQSYSMTKYWQPGDNLPNSLPTYTMTFDPNKAQPQTLSKDNKIWDTWLNNGANRLYVLAQLPGMISDAEGDKDPRRQILPLACYRWIRHDRQIQIVIQKSGLNTISQLRPEH
jgi:hypothetical protein